MKRAAAFLLSILILQPMVRGAGTNDFEARPFLAIWRDHEGRRQSSEAPYLRIAIWNDGRVVYARDAGKWGHDLCEGKIDAARIAALKKAIAGTGVFELGANSYLVADAPMDCLIVEAGDKQQMLYWDENEAPDHGSNSNPKPHYLAFKRIWKEVNRLALEVVPAGCTPHTRRFSRPSHFWRLKRPAYAK